MLSLSEVAGMLSQAVLLGPGDLRIDGVSTDSRTSAPGDLFVAFAGERFDGHAFIGAARAKGAAAVLLERPLDDPFPSVVVPDARRALGEIARGWRRRFDIPVIGVVGSNGKTTTKEMLSAILEACYGADGRLATRGNLNNDIGVPLTLLRLRSAHRAAVVEMGMNHPGETRWLAEIAGPTVLVVTNAQREHQEFMQSVAAVAEEHALAIAALPPTGVAVFPADDPEAAVWRGASAARSAREFTVADAGMPLPTAAAAHVAVRAVAHLGLFDTVVHFETPEGAMTAKLATAGLHNVRNAAAAASAALAAGIPLASIRQGLERFAPVRGRLQPHRDARGNLILDDTYNANPDSVRAAIEVLAASPAPQLLILGDMGEVGSQGPAYHAEIGAFARSSGVETFYATGPQMETAVRAFGAGASHWPDLNALISATRTWLDAPDRSGATVLVKGSRFMGMEAVVAALTATAPSQDPGVH